MFATPAMHMTLNGMMCRLFTFVVMIVNNDDGAVEGERYYNYVGPENVVVGEEKRLLWDVMDEWVKQTETLNVTSSIIKNENEKKKTKVASI